MQKITNLIICVLYNCNFFISVKPYIGYKFNQVDFAIFLNDGMLYDSKILQNCLSLNNFPLQINQFYTVNVRLDL